MGELAVAYQTAWTMAHKLRHGLSEDPNHPLRGFLEGTEGSQTLSGVRWGETDSNPRSPVKNNPLVETVCSTFPVLPFRAGKEGQGGREGTFSPRSVAHASSASRSLHPLAVIAKELAYCEVGNCGSRRPLDDFVGASYQFIIGDHSYSSSPASKNPVVLAV
jgi:hypothetical protein